MLWRRHWFGTLRGRAVLTILGPSQDGVSESPEPSVGVKRGVALVPYEVGTSSVWTKAAWVSDQMGASYPNWLSKPWMGPLPVGPVVTVNRRSKSWISTSCDNKSASPPYFPPSLGWVVSPAKYGAHGSSPCCQLAKTTPPANKLKLIWFQTTRRRWKFKAHFTYPISPPSTDETCSYTQESVSITCNRFHKCEHWINVPYSETKEQTRHSNVPPVTFCQSFWSMPLAHHHPFTSVCVI